MVVVDYSTSNDRYRRNENDEGIDRRQLLLDYDTAVNSTITNFCPKLRQAVSLLSRHKVGPLRQRVYLSDFRSSNTALPTVDGLNSVVSPPRYDRFVLAIPYFCEEMSPLSNYKYMVRWSVIAQCGRPDQAPEVSLLGLDDSTLISGYGDATLKSSQSNQRSHHQRLQKNSHQLIQERFWQQYVISEAFSMDCLTKWKPVKNANFFCLQYCILADQLYQSYARFQLYKLKLLLSTPSKIQPSPQLVQAYTQYKQLSESTVVDINSNETEVSIELLVKFDGINTNDYDERRHQTTPIVVVHIRAIISIASYEQSITSSEVVDKSDENRVLTLLASVSTTFPTTASSISGAARTKNSPVPSSPMYNTNNTLNNKYVVRVLNPKLDCSSHQGAMMAMMLDATTEQCSDTRMIDFVTYVRRVQHAAVQAYNCEVSSSDDDKSSTDSIDDESVELLLKTLNEAFCDSPSNGNYLLDYQISDQSTSFIRFLLIDGDVVNETTQLKYILTLECNKPVNYDYSSNTDNEDTDKSITKPLVPVVSLRSVYNHEELENYLNIDVTDITSTADDNEKYINQLASIIKIAVINGMQQLRHKVVTSVLTQYNRKSSPFDP